jgi:hypothetical protein
MGTVVVMDGVIAADVGIITGGAEVVATTMVGGIIAIGDLICQLERSRLNWWPLYWGGTRRTTEPKNTFHQSNAAMFRRMDDEQSMEAILRRIRERYAEHLLEQGSRAGSSAIAPSCSGHCAIKATRPKG